jgi:hypothetical protein
MKTVQSDLKYSIGTTKELSINLIGRFIYNMQNLFNLEVSVYICRHDQLFQN